MFAATFGILEFLFRRLRIHDHTLTLCIREPLRLELRQRERLGTRMEGTGDGPHQPVFGHPPTPNTALIEIGLNLAKATIAAK